MNTSYRACKTCRARIILARDLPPLDYSRSDFGAFAVRHEASGAWRGHRLATGEQPGPGEYRHAVHQCGEA